jgi:hypothetical protein
MDPFFQAQLILWLAAGGALGVHWFFMRGYAREKKKRGD